MNEQSEIELEDLLVLAYQSYAAHEATGFNADLPSSDRHCKLVDQIIATPAKSLLAFSRKCRFLFQEHGRHGAIEGEAFKSLAADIAGIIDLPYGSLPSRVTPERLDKFKNLEGSVCQVERLASLAAKLATEDEITDENEDFIIMTVCLARDEARQLKNNYYFAYHNL